MARPYGGKWVQGKIFLDRQEDCYIYKRPSTKCWQYYLNIQGEGEERKSTKVKGDPDDPSVGQDEALKVALDRKLEVMSRQKQGLKARRVKKMFDFIDDFLGEEKKRIADYNKAGSITAETFRQKNHHLRLLRKFYKDKSFKLEDLDYVKLRKYPTWRQTTTCDEKNPIAIKPPKRSHSILMELTTIKAYFKYLFNLGIIPRQPEFVEIKRESLRVNRRDYLNLRQYQQTLNTVRSWSNAKNLTNTQSYNKKVLYISMMIMSNACLRKGELKGLRWYDLEPNTNLSKKDQQMGHLIRIRKEISKTGEPRTIQTPTIKRFDELRELSGIPKHRGSSFPHVPPEYRNNYVISKYNHHDQPLGVGTWDRCWKEIKDLCSKRYWNDKNITWYSFRHTGISFAVSRGVPLLQLSRNCGTGVRYVESVYYHHESESKTTWDTLTQNRTFFEHINNHSNDFQVGLEDIDFEGKTI